MHESLEMEPYGVNGYLLLRDCHKDWSQPCDCLNFMNYNNCMAGNKPYQCYYKLIMEWLWVTSALVHSLNYEK